MTTVAPVEVAPRGIRRWWVNHDSRGRVLISTSRLSALFGVAIVTYDDVPVRVYGGPFAPTRAVWFAERHLRCNRSE